MKSILVLLSLLIGLALFRHLHNTYLVTGNELRIKDIAVVDKK